ncbi:MAG: ParB/RepB/Spo0J family partition protein [Longimicrobiales bacterium]
MTRRDRLGKGLGALLGEYLGDQVGVPTVRSLPVASIAPNPFQPRRDFSDEDLSELAASMSQNGLLQPVVVRPVASPGGAGPRWELVAGERRWRAAMRLGWKEIAGAVRDVDDRTLLVLALVENLQRAGLSPLEEADGFRRLGEEFSLSQQQIADVVGRDRSTVANAMRLLQLPASVRQMVADGRLTAGHARALLGLGSDRRITALAREAAEKGWSVREVEAQVQRQSPKRRVRAGGDRARDPAEQHLEDELQRLFGTAVRIRRARGVNGRIEIPFYGAEDFERVFEMLVGKNAAEVLS